MQDEREGEGMGHREPLEQQRPSQSGDVLRVDIAPTTECTVPHFRPERTFTDRSATTARALVDQRLVPQVSDLADRPESGETAQNAGKQRGTVLSSARDQEDTH